MSAPELKPCPFCGGEALISRYGTRRFSTVVECTECGCTLENGETFRHGEAWNTRSDHAPDLLEALERTLNYIENTEGGLGITLECGDIARAAIAKAKGGDT